MLAARRPVLSRYPRRILARQPAWVNFKLFGSLGLMLVFVVGQSMMLTKYLDKADLEKEKKQ